MSNPTPPRELLDLIEALVNGTIDVEGFAQLDAMLRDQPESRQYYRRYLNLHAALPGLVGNAPRLSLTLSDQPGDQLTDLGRLPDAGFIRLLMEVEAPGDSVALVDATELVAQRQRANRHPRFASPLPLIYAGLAAAVLVIATTLIIVFTGGPTPTAPIADQPIGPKRPAARTVATITAEHDAQWRTPAGKTAPSVGDELAVGQMLDLVDGFVQITTARGAVAILEAPCTVEMLDDNAIRLHTGKLVGICETESSKGFLVRAPQMDVTDLGTRFGVDTVDLYRTVVQVIEGKVEVAWQNQAVGGIQREEVDAGLAMQADLAGVARRVAYEPQRFVVDLDLERLRPRFADSNAVWLGQLSGDLGQDMRQADALQVFLERQGLTLQQDVAVDFNQDHAWDPQGRVGLHQVAAGERVDVYLLHFDLIDGHANPEELVIDFGRPILGVIVSQATLNATDASLGVADVKYPVFQDEPLSSGYGHRGLNNRSSDLQINEDSIALKDDLSTISPDGTKLNLRLWGGEAGADAKMDQVRVLVRSKRVP